jgi:hypothetical protein
MYTPSTIINSAKKVLSAKVSSSTIQEVIQLSTKTPHSIMESASFPLLPTEIRLQIWRAAIPEGRFIWAEIRNIDHFPTGPFTVGTLSPTCIPTILHINHESRCVGLSIFHLSLKPTKDDKDINSIGYWNPSADTIFLSNTYPVTRNHRPEGWTYSSTLGEIRDLCHVKHLALPWNIDISTGLQFKIPGLTERPWMPRWLTSEVLESVTFVVPFNLTAWNEETERKAVLNESEKGRWKILMKSQAKATAYSILTHEWIQNSRLTTAETKAEIERIFQEFREMDEQDGMTWKVPVVDVQAIAHDMEEIRRRRKDFWIAARNRGNEVSRHNSPPA